VEAGKTKRGSINVQLTSCLTRLDWSVLQMKTKIVSCHTADSKPVKQEVNSTMIRPYLVFPCRGIAENFKTLPVDTSFEHIVAKAMFFF